MAKPRIYPPSKIIWSPDTMRVALIAAHPTLALKLCPVIDELYPQAKENPFIATFLKPYGDFLPPFGFPRDLAWSDFPAVLEPSYRRPFIGVPLSWFSMKFGEKWSVTDEELDYVKRLENPLDREGEYELIRNADVVIAAIDYTPIYALTLVNFLKRVFPDGAPLDRILYPIPGASRHYEHDVLRDQLVDAPTLREAKAALVPYATSHMWFTFNYNLNSVAIIGRAMSAAGLETKDGVPLGSALQLLYRLERVGSLNGREGLASVRAWHGTGKYTTEPAPWNLFGPGKGTDAANRLLRTGLAERFGEANEMIRVTDAGRRLLSFLHPDCEDPDLLFRLDHWCNLPVDEARPKIDRYIRTFFGKQKRFLSRHLPEATLS